jgi:putative ABC transport system ATP-binding protein
MTDTIIRLAGIRKSYGTGEQAAIALDRIDLEVARGEFVSLMGPSGSGKTTLLNVIAGLDFPDGGSVLLDGVDLSTLADHQLADLRLQKLGFVFQAFNLIPALTVEENVSWPLEFAGHSRFASARAIATGPSILLADEPTGNLDSLTGQKILDLLRALNESEGVTVVMVTHNVLAATYGDRTLEMQDGRIIRDVRTPPKVRGGKAAGEER